MTCRSTLLTLSVALALAGCATAPPARLGLTLAPAALGQSIALAQHLKVERDGRIDELDAALEVDADHLELVGLAFGQRVLTVSYDGKKLTSWRHLMLPRQVRAEDVLEDLQLTLWPAESIARALPAGWRIDDNGLQRTLSMDGTPLVLINYSAMPRWSGTVTLQNLRYHYRLTIESAPGI